MLTCLIFLTFWHEYADITEEDLPAYKKRKTKKKERTKNEQMNNSLSSPKDIKLTFSQKILLLRQAQCWDHNKRSQQLPLAKIFKIISVELSLSSITTKRAISIFIYFSLLNLFMLILCYMLTVRSFKQTLFGSKFQFQLKLRKVTLHLKEDYWRLFFILKNICESFCEGLWLLFTIRKIIRFCWWA